MEISPINFSDVAQIKVEDVTAWFCQWCSLSVIVSLTGVQIDTDIQDIFKRPYVRVSQWRSCLESYQNI